MRDFCLSFLFCFCPDFMALFICCFLGGYSIQLRVAYTLQSTRLKYHRVLTATCRLFLFSKKWTESGYLSHLKQVLVFVATTGEWKRLTGYSV